VQSLIRELREAESPARPVFIGRALHVALREEEFSGVMAINEALMGLSQSSSARTELQIYCLLMSKALVRFDSLSS
jgi:hypothetical protein